MASTTFLLGIHKHQPIGNFPEVLEMGYQKSYMPFLEVLKNHPSIKWSLHLSGILWDFMMDRHPEYVKTVKKMVDDGQVEILSGGYYEPILAAIPDRDKVGQIKKLNTFIKNNFGQTPRGIWLTERIWEPTLPKILSELGIEYTLTDDYHFLAAGRNPDELRGYYVTEDEGYKLNIFPISQKLRYYIPFENVEKSIELFRNNSKYNSSLTMGDDGEKFGMWPKTYEHVYRDGWLNRFLEALESNKDWLKTATFSEFLKSHSPSGRIYLPTTSYFEMSEWTLPADFQQELDSVLHNLDHVAGGQKIKKFVRGGFWRNFLTKYTESNNMHKKMLYVSEKINKAAENRKLKSEKTKKSKSLVTTISQATDYLYAAQCNCAYWHGIFGGLYLPHLRKAIYENLIMAEKLIAPKSAKIIQTDINKDGREEIIYESPSQNLYFSPAFGGCIYEWDLLEPAVNVLNVLTRRYEAYHKKLKEQLNVSGGDTGVATIHNIVRVKEKNLDRYLNYDWHNRTMLLDHFLSPQTTINDFYSSKYTDMGNFTLEPYKIDHLTSKVITLSRTGDVRVGNSLHKMKIAKTIKPQANRSIKVEYNLTNLSDSKSEFWFAVESNLAFFSGFRQQEEKEFKNFVFDDAGTGLKFNLKISPVGILWTFPIETVSLSEDGFERTLQGGCVVTSWRFELSSGESRSFEIEISWHSEMSNS